MTDRPRIVCVFGTRPEAIKMAPVVRALGAPGSGLEPVVCATDQHREMLAQVLACFGLQPDHRLDVMQAGQQPGEVAARVLDRLPPVLAVVRPAAVLVQGDTTSTLAAALAAFLCPRAGRTRGSRPPHPTPGLALSRGRQSADHHRARALALRPHRGGAPEPAARSRAGDPHRRHRKPGGRRQPCCGRWTAWAHTVSWRCRRIRRGGCCSSPRTGGRASAARWRSCARRSVSWSMTIPTSRSRIPST